MENKRTECDIAAAVVVFIRAEGMLIALGQVGTWTICFSSIRSDENR